MEFITYKKWLLISIIAMTLLGIICILTSTHLIGLISFLGAIVLSKYTLKRYTFYRKLRIWIKRHNHKKLLFYPGNKKRQKIVDQEIIPLLDGHYAIYNNGNSLMGDMNRNLIRELMNFYGLEMNKPALIGLNNQSLIISPLSEEIDKYLKKKIERKEFVSSIKGKISELND